MPRARGMSSRNFSCERPSSLWAPWMMSVGACTRATCSQGVPRRHRVGAGALPAHPLVELLDVLVVVDEEVVDQPLRQLPEIGPRPVAAPALPDLNEVAAVGAGRVVAMTPDVRRAPIGRPPVEGLLEHHPADSLRVVGGEGDRDLRPGLLAVEVSALDAELTEDPDEGARELLDRGVGLGRPVGLAVARRGDRDAVEVLLEAGHQPRVGRR